MNLFILGVAKKVEHFSHFYFCVYQVYRCILFLSFVVVSASSCVGLILWVSFILSSLLSFFPSGLLLLLYNVNWARFGVYILVFCLLSSTFNFTTKFHSIFIALSGFMFYLFRRSIFLCLFFLPFINDTEPFSFSFSVSSPFQLNFLSAFSQFFLYYHLGFALVVS